MKRWIFTATISVASMGALIYWLLHQGGFDPRVLLQVPAYFLLIGGLLAFGDVALRGLRLHMVTRQVEARIPWRRAVQIILGVDFFAAITPSRLGGEPARLVGLMQQGVVANKALIVLGIEALMDLGYLAMAVPLFFLTTHDASMSPLIRALAPVVVGFCSMFLIPVVFLLLKERQVRRFFSWLERQAPTFNRLISGYGRWHPQESVVALRANLLFALKGPKWYLPAGVALTTTWWVLRCSSLAWLGEVFGFQLKIAEILWPQFLIFNSLALTPVPVGGGVVEASFLLLYKGLIGATVIPAVMVLWRFFTFYIFVLGGAVTTTRGMWRLTLRKLSKNAETSKKLSSVA